MAISATPIKQATRAVRLVFAAWDFATEGVAEGWNPVHDLGTFSFDQEGLHTSSIGGDPYMLGPNVEIDADAATYVEVRMRATAGNDAQMFWVTQQDRRYDEAKSQHFAVKGDGAWHTYQVSLRDNPAWTGTIVQLRLDPSNQKGSEITIDRIRVLGPKPGAIEVRTFGPRRAVVDGAAPFEIRAQIVNEGDAAVAEADLTLTLPSGLTLVEGDANVHLENVESRVEREITWQVEGMPGVYALSLDSGDSTLAGTFAILAELDGVAESLESETLRLAFAPQSFGYGVATLSRRDGDNWRPLGRLRALGALTYRVAGEDERQTLVFAERIERTKDGLELPYTFATDDGTTWRGSSTFQLAPGGQAIDVHSTLQADADVEIVSWTGLAFYAGDGAFGRRKESALFPGIEFLLDEEQSSGTDFINPPANLRYVPHPHKVTVPLMSVTHSGTSVGLTWDPLQQWDATRPIDRPGALYAVPNTWDGQENQLMALFVGYGEENRVDGLPPFALPSRSALHLRGRLFAIPAEDALAPLAFWLESYDLPELPPLPRSYDEGIRLSLDSTLGPTWVESAQGWHYAIHDPWGPGSSPANELHLWLGTLRGDLSTEEQATSRELVRELSRRTDYVGGQPNPLLYVPTLYMHLADRDELLDTAKHAGPMLAGQDAEGFWPYRPQARSGRPFGTAGDTSSGQIAAKALYLLRFARITGDPALREAGLRALDYMEAHHSRRPEGAQIWELPLHCPDLLAAAWAEQCYLEAYWLTGEAHYARQAQQWALSGLPFVYLWSAPDRPVMAYTTVPVFAATNYTYPWLGRPVMWNGLDYAFGLWHLNGALEEAGIEAIVDWRQVAEGITRAAMQMQPESGDYLGMYPDAWDVVAGGEAYSWWLHPFYILQNLYVMQGTGAEVRTVILRDGTEAVHVNAVADIQRAQRTSGRIEIELAYYAGETSIVMINRLLQSPGEILLDNKPLSEITSLASEATGWLYRGGTLLIKVPFENTRAVVAVH